MLLPRPSEGNIKTAAQLVAEVTERIKVTNPGERTEWPYSPFMRNISFPEFFSSELPISKFLIPKSPNLQLELGEAEEIKALRQILSPDTATLIDITPQELQDRFKKGKWEDGSVVNVDKNSYYFRLATGLQGQSGEEMFFYLIVKRIGPHITVKQFLSNPLIEKIIGDKKQEEEKAMNGIQAEAGPAKTPRSVLGHIKGSQLMSILESYGRELVEGHKLETILSKLTASEQFRYIAALNTMVLLVDSGINIGKILNVTFRRTGEDPRDLACDIRLKSDLPEGTETVTINVAELDKRKYRIILFPK